MNKIYQNLIYSSVLFALFIASCSSPKMLFMVADGKPLDENPEQVNVLRDDKNEDVKNNLKLKEGDVLQIDQGVDGVGFISFDIESTVHGASTLVIQKEYLEQQSGIAIHNASAGKLVIPDMSISHENAAYLVAIDEKTTELIVFNGRILVSSTKATPSWKPFYVESRQKRKIWRDGRLAPNQPLQPDDMNAWIDRENQLLKAGRSKYRMVPSVVSLPSADAKGLVASAEFPVNMRYTEEGTGELGTITKQEPQGGQRVESNKTVAIYERSRPVVIPNVIGLSFGAAKSALKDIGLEAKETPKTITRSVESGFVNAQNPAANEMISEGSTILLTVEAVSVTVPKVTGLTMDKASQALKGLKMELQNTVYDENHNSAPVVISQIPSAGAFVLGGSIVKIVRQAKGFKTPNVVGKTETQAIKTITADGFPIGQTVKEHSDSVATGTVISQKPAANEVSGKDVPVVLTVSKGSK